MRFIETKKLNDYILSTGDFLRCTTEDFSAKLSSLESVSLQSVSLEHDRSFLKELSSVLNVIVSIIYHPHIANKREEVIIRIEQAQQIGQEAFLNTVKDSKLWKEHNVRMVPEEVYYYQHIDELRIYENRFIAFLIDLIDKELAKFSNFYLSKLPTLTSLSSTLDSREIGEVIVEIDRLRRKTQFIQNTFFYKETSKGKPISRKIQPTNILLKDRLYRYCFKFYKSFMRYEDVNDTKRDLRTYYMILLFKELLAQGFRIQSASEKKYVFENGEFTLTLTPEVGETLALQVLCHRFPTTSARHLLGFHVETEKAIGAASGEEKKGYEGCEMLSLWELCYADVPNAAATLKTDTEEALIRSWLSDKLSLVATDRYIYQKYCPVCRSRGVDSTEGVYSCPACDSRYMFDHSNEDTVAWFRKIRKKGIS